MYVYMGFPGGSAGKESTYNAGDLGSLPEGNSYPLQYSGLENSYSPWCHKESNTTERFSLFFFHIYIKFRSRCIFSP